MSGLAAVLAGHQDPGVYRWQAAFDADEVRHTVEHVGWTFGYVDGWLGETEADFHAALAVTFGFPDWYGGNLDALWDCLLTCVREPAVLLWDGWGPLARSAPERFPRLLQVFHDRTATDEGPAFTLLLRGEGPEIDVPSLD